MRHPILFGEYDLTIDDKNRLLIPSEIRKQIDPARDGEGFFLTIGTNRRLWLYTSAYYEALVLQEPGEMIPGTDRLEFDLLNFALASKVETDKQGRLLVPDKLLKRSATGKDVYLIGVRNHLELWNRDEWDTQREELVRRREQVAMAARLARPGNAGGSNPESR